MARIVMGRWDYCVVGPGSIGLLLSFFLRGSNTLLIARSADKRRKLEQGASIVVGREEMFFTPSVLSWGEIGAETRCTTIMFATKAYDLEEALRAARVLGEPGLAVSLQNGLGLLEMLEEAYGAPRAAAGIVEYGAYRESSTRVVVAGASGRIALGHRSRPPTPLLRRLARSLEEGGAKVVLVDDVVPYRMLKALANAVINPITAVAGTPNKAVVEAPPLRRLARSLLDELIRILPSEQVSRLPEEPWPYLERLALATGDNYSSMLRDLRERGRTEIDYINGWFAERARLRGVPTPINNALLLLVKGLEHWRRRSRRGGSSSARAGSP